MANPFKSAASRGKSANFIAGAIKRPGALTRKAKAAGMSTQAYAKAKAGAKGRTGQQARFAEFLNKVRPKGKGKG